MDWEFGVGRCKLLHLEWINNKVLMYSTGKYIQHPVIRTSLVAQIGKASAYNAGDPGSIPGSGRSPGEGNGNPLKYSCLENPMDGRAW